MKQDLPKADQSQYVLESTRYSFTYPIVTNYEDHRRMYREMITWITKNINDYNRNAMWMKLDERVYIAFANEKDAMVFVLKFGDGTWITPILC